MRRIGQAVQFVFGKRFVYRCQAEIDQLGLTAAGNQHVAHFQVPVRQAVVKRVTQALDDIQHQAGGFHGMEFLAYFNEVPQVSALDKLHHEKVGAAVGHNLVNAHDIGVPQ